jgi:predicted nucleic acid-binding protein
VSAPAPALHIAEPPAQYLRRPPLVVDCSALAGIFFGEDWQEEARSRISGYTLHAPHLIHCEIASVAVKKQRRGEPHAAQALAQAAAIEINLHPIDPQPVAALALQYSLTAYDAAYLWLAAELKAPLATFDDKLGAAARTHLASLE